MNRTISIIDRRVQDCKSKMEQLFDKIYCSTATCDKDDLPLLRLKYLVKDYQDFENIETDS